MMVLLRSFDMHETLHIAATLPFFKIVCIHLSLISEVVSKGKSPLIKIETESNNEEIFYWDSNNGDHGLCWFGFGSDEKR